jgi:flagellar motor switch/type III secretory pathway protein FliN
MNRQAELPDLESALIALTLEYSQIGVEEGRGLNLLSPDPGLLKTATVKAQVVLGQVSFNLSDLLRLRGDEVLTLDSTLGIAVQILLDGQPAASIQMMATDARFSVRAAGGGGDLAVQPAGRA